MAEIKQAVELRGLKKYFPGTKALDWEEDDVIEIREGEIHGLIGENGAGKSTLFQILMGIYDRTGGTMKLYGEPYDPKNVHEAEAAGVSIIMQQPNFAYNLSVAENIFLGQEKKFTNKAGLIDWKKEFAEADEILKRFDFDNIKSTDLLCDLGYEETKQVEIARALSQNPRLLLVDETSAAISKKSVNRLYELLREQAANGCAVLYISHFIDEVYELCDRVSILRDGKLITRMDMNESVSPDLIIQNMVGRDMSDQVYRSEDNSSIGEVMLETKNLCRNGEFKNININVRAGEIVGIAGIGGCGSESFGKALFGYDRINSGEVIFKGKSIKLKSTLDAMNHRIGFIPKDRDKEGLFLIYGSSMNISASNMKNVSRRGWIRLKREETLAVDAVKQYLIKTPTAKTPVSDLSGGNRQKVAIAKWIANDSEFLIVNGPTRGVDVGAKYEIYKILEVTKNQGKGILLISDELTELIGMCDRIYCFRDGEVSGELSRSDFAEDRLMGHMV